MSHADPPSVPSANSRLDRATFAALYESAYQRLWLLAAGIVGDRHAAHDIVQDSTLAAFSKLEQFEPGSNFSAWLARFVRWHAFNYSRKHTARGTLPADPQLLDLSVATDRSPEINLENDAAGQILDDQPHFDDEVSRALRSINPTGRACLLLRTIHQLSYREIAELLEIPEGTAMSHVHRARQMMRDRLQGYPNWEISSDETT